MSRFLLLLAMIPTGCSVHTLTADAEAAPSSPMVYNPSCFGSYEEERLSTAQPTGSVRGGGGGWGGPKSSPKKRASGAVARPAPAPMDPSMAPMMEEAEAAPAPPAKATVAPPPAESDAVADVGADDSWSKKEARRSGGEWQNEVQRPAFDWGGSTYLSNDDSMSLASAQRLLWALDRGQRVSTSQIRPHEVLNYFSFDTEEPKAGETFEVTASAEQHGDSLAVAFAVQGATPERQPLDLTMLVDRSCSMQDEGRMEYTKRGLTQMSEQLEKGDRVDIVLFDDAVCTPLENFVVGRDDPGILQSVIQQMQPDGGTNMDRGLKEGYRVASRKTGTHKRNRRVMAITDAFLNQGDVNPNTVSEIGKAFENDGIRLTGIGVGTSFNDTVLNKLTEKGKGAYVYLGSEAVVDRVFGSGFDSLVQTIAHDVHFKLDLPDSLALERFYGEEASTNKADVQAIHYYAGTSQVFLQDLKVKDSGLVGSDKVKLEVTWTDARTGEPEKRLFHTSVASMIEADPHNVRKARALMAWTDVLTAQSMGGNACGAEMGEYGRRVSLLGDDAEMAYVDKLMANTCPRYSRNSWTPEPSSYATVNLKVKVDSDIPIAEVEADCKSGTVSEGLSGSDTVARFEVAPGTCTLTFAGAVPMRTTIEVASTDTDVRCMVRGGRLSCDG